VVQHSPAAPEEPSDLAGGNLVRKQIDEYLSFLAQERRLSVNTVSAYRNDLIQLERYLGTARASALRRDNAPADGRASREQILDFVLELRERGYAPATIARKVAATRSLFHYLAERGDGGGDPTADLGSPEVRKPLPKTLSTRDVALLLERAERKPGADGLRDRAMFHLLYSTGMRVTELVSLDMADADLRTDQVRCVGRGGRERQIPLESAARLALIDYLQRGRGVFARSGGELALFLNHRGDRLTRQGFWLLMKALARESGISAPVTPHTLRHSFAAHRLRDGVALERLRELLGHANISTTQIYAQVPASTARQDSPPPRTAELTPVSQ